MRLVAATLFATSALHAPAATEQVRDGRVLIHRSGCGHCHALGSTAGAPGLTGLQARFPDSSILPKLIAAPRSLKANSRMPHLFGKNHSLKSDEVTALTHYLLSLPPKNQPPDPPRGDRARGRALYHQIGCAACHQPEDTAPLPDSVPIVTAKHYGHDALAAYLLEPDSALMPSLKLTPQEASDLAVYLQPDLKPIREASASLSPELAKRGHALFRSLRCASCHGSPGGQPEPRRPPIDITNWNDGCLSDSPAFGIPHFAFTPDQRQSIRAAAKNLSPQTPEERIDHTLTALRCDACHQRHGRGGPPDARRPFFTARQDGAESYGDFGTVPPKLDHVGRRLTRSWLRKILVDGHGEVRPYLATRMPHYRLPETEIESLLDALETADRRDPPITIDVSGLPGHQRAHFGRNLMGSKGLNCITCHGLKGRRALGAPSTELTHTVHRLRPAWFKELLLDPQSVQPGTLMPPLFLNRPKAAQEVEQIWTYLKELDQRRLPDGLLRTDDFELKPEEAGTPIVFRTFLQGVGTHAIAVGFPQGTHLAFDSRTSQWALLWKGRFLDAMSTWDDRFAPPAKPLGDTVHTFPMDELPRQFQGFRLDQNGVPTFLYLEKGTLIEDTIAPDARGNLTRTLRRGNATTRQTVTRQSIQLEGQRASFHAHDEK